MRDAAKAQPMWGDAVFSIASMTKPMTSAAIMMLHEEGRLLLGDPVSKFLPALAGMKVAKSPTAATLETVPAECEMTVQDLLRHTSGLTYGFQLRTNVDAAYRSLDNVISTHGYEIYYFGDFDINAEVIKLDQCSEIHKWKQTINIYAVPINKK
jgi:CubicO group peptidase (beta-lactamase class C family)